jgi:hypothetical protein
LPTNGPSPPAGSGSPARTRNHRDQRLGQVGGSQQDPVVYETANTTTANSAGPIIAIAGNNFRIVANGFAREIRRCGGKACIHCHFVARASEDAALPVRTRACDGGPKAEIIFGRCSIQPLY